MLNRILSPAIAPKLQLTGRIWQYSKSAGCSRSHNTSPTLNKPTDGEVVENVELTFVEEPLGLRADQGYGYLQVDFGQRIGSGKWYEILRKLGWGGNASVWLARDHEQGRYVAIKVLTGMATNLHDRGFMQELPVMRRVSKLIRASGQPAYCTLLHSHFVHPGKPGDGDHLCLVMDVLGADIEALQGISSPTSKTYPARHPSWPRTVACLWLCAYSHPEATSEAAVCALLKADPSRQHPPEPSWDYHVSAAVSQPLPPPPKDQDLSGSFVIADFGSAQFVDKKVVSHITPDTLRAPESIMKGPWNSKVDIWTFGCLVFEFMLGIPIFSRKHATMAPDDYHLAQIIKFTGEEFPPRLIKKYKLAPQFLDMQTVDDSDIREGHPFSAAGSSVLAGAANIDANVTYVNNASEVKETLSTLKPVDRSGYYVQKEYTLGD
ncbi:hypothetical protein PILCRDRAFT_425 [Piloderma croceum F 1598]|uniref:Protein kinase domain-containing protein n=1 Tax=Piloderma croceum (strain F 1598) TaxID=765440 RepID=A0A0C3GP95_PILCF|nr:hypothetical protein PILCRDRAFT_425 [Piloderma croceum F 1598]